VAIERRSRAGHSRESIPQVDIVLPSSVAPFKFLKPEQRMGSRRERGIAKNLLIVGQVGLTTTPVC